jgi:DNA-binding GntR family transcriptional regulator
MEGAVTTAFGAADLAIEPLAERESIEQRVAHSLRALIVAGHLPEGTQLVQRDLAARLGVSQTPVRASLGRLEREGFVAVGSTGRAFVSRLTREDFEEIYAARLGLEGLAARLGAEAVGPGELASMQETLEKLEQAAAEQDVAAYLALRWEFYGTCYRASGRRRLVEEVERLYWRSERYNRIVLSTAQRFRESLGRYADFFSSCEAKDGPAAERVVEDSLRWAVHSAAGGLPSEADCA